MTSWSSRHLGCPQRIPDAATGRRKQKKSFHVKKLLRLLENAGPVCPREHMGALVKLKNYKGLSGKEQGKGVSGGLTSCREWVRPLKRTASVETEFRHRWAPGVRPTSG